jgi:putative Holliday junction resolvase
MTKKTLKPQGERTVMGFDFGTKSIGIAIGQELTGSATSLKAVKAQDGIPNWDDIAVQVKEWQPDLMVVGLPLNMDGTSSMLSKRAHKFARRLAHRVMEQHLPVTVSLCDERLTSIEAREIAWDNGWIKNERDPIDDISACILMSTYFADPNSSIAIDAIKAE